LASLLESNGIEIANVSNFAEIYYTGIELKDKVLIDIHKVNAKSDTKVYKTIRSRNLKDMGYKLIPIMVNPQEEGNTAMAIRIIQALKDQQ
jgi:predicted CoA-binding protein